MGGFGGGFGRAGAQPTEGLRQAHLPALQLRDSYRSPADSIAWARLGYRYLETLGGDWQGPEGLSLRIPFSWEGATELVLTRRLPPLAERPESLCIGLPAVAWQAELYWEGRLLGLHGQPQQPWVLPLPRALRSARPSVLRLHLRLPPVPDSSLFARPFLGLLAPPVLLRPAAAGTLAQAQDPPPCPPGASVLRWVPYSPAYGWVVDSAEFAARLDYLRQHWGPAQREVYISLPWPATAAHRGALQQAGLRTCSCTAEQMRSGRWPMAFAYPFPGYNAPAQQHIPHWMGPTGLPTADWGRLVRWPLATEPLLLSRDQTIAALLLLLLLLTLWKAVYPHSFQRYILLQGFGQRGRTRLGLQPGERTLALTLLHLVHIGLVLHLYQYLNLHPELLHPASMARALTDVPPLEAYTVLTLGGLLHWALRQGIHAALTHIYQFRGLQAQLLDMELGWWLPALVLLPLLGLSLQVASPALLLQSLPYLAGSWALLALYRMLRLAQALRSRWGVSLLGVVSYICVLDILPWLLLL